MNLVELLRAFGADEALIALAERWTARQVAEDGAVTYPDGVEALADEDVAALLSGLIALGEDDAAGIGLLEAAADTAVDLRTEQAAREDAVAAEEADAEAARARLRGEAPADEVPDPDAAPDPDAPEVDPDAPEVDPDAPAVDPANDPESVTAAGGRADLRSLARRQSRRAAPAVDVDASVRSTITFAADVPGVPSGSEVVADRANLVRVSDAMQRRAESFRRSASGVSEEIVVATLNARYPEDRRLVDETGQMLAAAQCGRIIGRVLERELTPEAITAAGGLCAPLVPYFGVEVIGDDYRPVRDEALVGFQASRGGVISMAPPILPNLAGSVAIWTMDDDVLAVTDEDHVKAILEVTCGDTRTTRIRAITARLRMGNILARTYGEWTQAWADLQLVAQARLAETALLGDIKNGSTLITRETTTVSATRDTLNLLNRLAWGVRSRRRVRPDGLPMRVILPEVWLGIAAEDIANGFAEVAPDNLALAVAQILQWFRSRNLNVTWSPDLNMIGEQGATAAADWPPFVDFAIYPEGTWLHLDNGGIDLGVVRDTRTNERNNFETFSETFEAAHKLGNDSAWGTLNVCPSGAVNGTLDPAGRCASYT